VQTWAFQGGEPVRIVERTPTGKFVVTILSNDMDKISSGEHVLEHHTHPENWIAMELGGEENSFALLRVFPDLELEQMLEIVCLTEELNKHLGMDIPETYKHMI
jgi:hypothetical protein